MNREKSAVRGTTAKSLVLVALCVLLSACATMNRVAKPELQDEGEIYLYVQPLQAAPETLSLILDQCAITNSEGAEFLLGTILPEIDGRSFRRQRFLAALRLPPGHYSGMSCVVKASETGVSGERHLLMTEAKVTLPLTFEVGLKKAMVLALEFRLPEATEPGAAPSLRLSIPKTPASGLLGYVPNRDDNTITVFDKKSGEVSTVIETGRAPEGVVFDEISRIAYLSLEGEDVIEARDITQGTVTQRLTLNMGDAPSELLLTPDRRTLLVLNRGSRTLSLLDTASLTEIARLQLEEGPRRLLLGRDGVRCYVFNELSNTISVVDVANRAIVTTISTEAGPLMGQFNRKGDRLYVIFRGSPYLAVIDPLSLSLVKRVYVGMGLSAIKVDSSSDLLYAYRNGDPRIEIYDPLSLMPTDWIFGITGVIRMTIDGESNSLVLLSPEKKKLVSVGIVSKKVVAETDTGEHPSWSTMMGER